MTALEDCLEKVEFTALGKNAFPTVEDYMEHLQKQLYKYRRALKDAIKMYNLETKEETMPKTGQTRILREAWHKKRNEIFKPFRITKIGGE